MGNLLRDRRTPTELAASGQLIEIAENISSFERLAEIVGADLQTLDPATLPPDWRDAIVTGRLVFGLSDARHRLPVVNGQVSVTVDAVCQRCLQLLRLPLVAELRLVFAADQESAGELDGYEIWELEEKTLQPLDLVEEALIMAMPLAAMHVDTAAEVREVGKEKTTRPFATLKSQMEQDN